MQNSYTPVMGSTVTTTSGGSTSVIVESGFKQLIGHPVKKGDFHKPNNWYYRSDEITYQNGQYLFMDATGKVITSVTGVLDSTGGFDMQPAINEAIARATAKAIDELYESLRGNTDLLSSVAEQSQQGFRRTARKYVDFVIGWKRKIRKLELKDISRAWLTAQYELIPLASDVFAVAQALNGALTRNGIDLTFKGHHRSSHSPKPLVSRGYSWGSHAPAGDYECHAKGKFKFVVNPSLDTAAQLTSLDPLVIGWNLMPWSFVIDWIYDVGSWVSAMETKARYASSFKGGYITTRFVSEAGFNQYVSGKSGGGRVSAQINSLIKTKTCTRTVYSSLPTPVKPRLNLEFGSKTLLNAAALLHVM